MIVIAEGIGELLPYAYVKDVERDDFGHIAISKLHLGRCWPRCTPTNTPNRPASRGRSPACNWGMNRAALRRMRST